MSVEVANSSAVGPTWSKPSVNFILKAADPLDYIVRAVKGLADMPKLSLRVRSNGIRGQFGGSKFHNEGKELLELLTRQADLKSDSDILEIGCGVGRTARHLSKVLKTGSYIGMDIESVSVDTIRNTLGPKNPEFTFQQLDIHNNLFNPDGSQSAAEYKFPYDSESLDLVFHFSVFTHMLEQDVRNYISQVSKLLRPGGIHCFSIFICGPNPDLELESLPYNLGQARIQSEAMPEVAVGYTMEFFEEVFGECGMRLHTDPVYGQWRASHRSDIDMQFRQDILMFVKE